MRLQGKLPIIIYQQQADKRIEMKLHLEQKENIEVEIFSGNYENDTTINWRGETCNFQLVRKQRRFTIAIWNCVKGKMKNYTTIK